MHDAALIDNWTPALRRKWLMGNATIQGKLWGMRPREFAERLEQVLIPLYGAVLDAGYVTPGTRLLDAGCGAGLLALLARLRGAHVAALDASAPLLEIARERLPAADVREGDLEALPFADASFDVVTAVNSVSLAADMAKAMRELSRVVRPRGRVVVTAWGPPDRCEFLAAAMPLVAPLMPPPPPGTAPAKPGASSGPGAWPVEVERAGLRVVDRGEVVCPFVFPNTEASWRAHASAGPHQLAIAHSGEAAVRAALTTADHAHKRPDGSIYYKNVFLWVVGERP
jgi:SAM-dependent methyltransferase